MLTLMRSCCQTA